jgi:hypothetical protein
VTVPVRTNRFVHWLHRRHPSFAHGGTISSISKPAIAAKAWKPQLDQKRRPLQ